MISVWRHLPTPLPCFMAFHDVGRSMSWAPWAVAQLLTSQGRFAAVSTELPGFHLGSFDSQKERSGGAALR